MSVFRQHIVVLLLISFSFSNAKRESLIGDDWIITSNGLSNFTIRGCVPGTIHTNLFRANKIPGPYMESNDVDLRFLIYQDWVFTKNISLSSEILASDQITLHFDQVDTVSTVTMNECLVGKTNNMFVAYTFPIAKRCLHANNQLQIHFESPLIYAANQSTAYNDTVLPLCPPKEQHGECHVQFIRKESSSFGSNWSPAFAPIGITGNVYVEGNNASKIMIKLESVNVALYDSNKKTWRIDVLLSSNHHSFSTLLKFVLVNTSWAFEKNTTLNYSVSISLSIPDDQVVRWWPNGFGDQSLYQLMVLNQDELIDSRLIGFRTVELVQTTYGPTINGTSFYFSINSRAIFIKGSNWIPSDAFQEQVTDEKLERLLISARIANMNMLRISGDGIYERDSFYEMADRLGMMLWHDFMFSNSLYPVDEAFLANVHGEILYQVKRLQHHPAIVIWNGNNENEVAIAQNWFGIPAEKLEKAKDDYRKLYVDAVMAAVKEVDKGTNRPFITSSPTNGLESISENYIANNPQDPLYGDVHYYSYSDDSWNFTTYPIARFLSATGLQSLPSLDSWLEVTSNLSDLDFQSPFVLHRQHTHGEMNTILTRIQTNLPLPITNNSILRFTQMIYLSQIVQAMTLKFITDVCRVHSSVDMIDPKTGEGHTMGLMYWQINDIWQAPTWSTIEYNLKWKMSHYYVRDMYNPIYLVVTLNPYLADITDETAQISLYLVNDGINGTGGELACVVYGLDDFSIRFALVSPIYMDSPGIRRFNDLPYALMMRDAGCNQSAQCIFRCSYQPSDNLQVDQTLLLTRPKNYHLYQPNIQIKSIEQRAPMDYDITLTADRPGLFVWLDTPSNITGYFSRNGFHMLDSNIVVSFHSWTDQTILHSHNFALRVTSLYDVIKP